PSPPPATAPSPGPAKAAPAKSTSAPPQSSKRPPPTPTPQSGRHPRTSPYEPAVQLNFGAAMQDPLNSARTRKGQVRGDGWRRLERNLVDMPRSEGKIEPGSASLPFAAAFTPRPRPHQHPPAMQTNRPAQPTTPIPETEPPPGTHDNPTKYSAVTPQPGLTNNNHWAASPAAANCSNAYGLCDSVDAFTHSRRPFRYMFTGVWKWPATTWSKARSGQIFDRDPHASTFLAHPYQGIP